MRIMKKRWGRLPQFEVRIKSGKQPLEGKPVDKGAIAYTLPGDQQVSIKWLK